LVYITTNRGTKRRLIKINWNYKKFLVKLENQRFLLLNLALQQ
jgi:glutathione peroxidase-family protein